VVDLDAYRAGRGGEEELRWEPNQEAGDLERLAAALPDEQREVVRLRFALDFRLEEIADALRIPLGTVKSRLHNALRSLREEVDRENRRGA
jgi:RNA polymerase sigma-70 factor (ECF subfamily)